ncbi:MAG TPA: pyruvate dehydrogenase complex dihydrolipoamide acetyltransferase, partial [Rhizobiales bacterium]|nr:pyruvate dehydrogenase complex dihydrolipoamide acetyltransferase [Hyphomicrobiales bacterium]
IETDKATMEVEAIDEGVLVKIVVPEGTADVPVNDVIGLIGGEGGDAKSVAVASAPHHAASLNGQGGPRVFASPLARRIAKESELDLASIAGSGPHGRIVERDVKAALAHGPAAVPAQDTKAPSVPLSTPPEELVRKSFAPGSFEEIPHDSMRKTIARRLVEASRTIPHFYLTADCNLDALMSLREAINAAAPRDKEGKPAYKISVNDFIVKALALALIRVPGANVTWTETAVLKHKHADVGVAVAIPGGLFTPIVRAAETKSLSVISSETKDFSTRARARKLRPEEYQGGSTAVSNLGMFGIKSFSAIINPPQATVLAVGAAEPRVVVKGGAPAVAILMGVTLSCDHRAVDGALGAELLAAFKAYIEDPVTMLV